MTVWFNRLRRSEFVAIGKRIREIQVSQGYTQENFAAEAGLDRAYYGGVERGERNVAALNWIQIANTLGVEIGELFPPTRALVRAKNMKR